MGARVLYAKVIDQDLFYARGARVHPGLHSKVLLSDEPGVAAPFLVLRAWGQDHGTFTEQWRIETPAGASIYESVPREIHLATHEHVERLEDAVSDLEFLYAADDYSVALVLDGRIAARSGFAVEPDPRATARARELTQESE